MERALKAYVKHGHRQVEGWIEPETLILVARLAEEQKRLGVSGGVAEIGVHHGRFFIGMCLTSRPSEASVAVDLFDDQVRNLDSSGSGDADNFKRNLVRHRGEGREVSIIQADSTTISSRAVVQLAGAPVRLFSVDGGHAAAIVEHDMRTAAGALQPGGIIIGDDVFNFQWPGASEGTLRYLDSTSDVVPFAIGFNKVYFGSPHYAEAFRSVTRSAARMGLWEIKDSIMHTHPVVIVWRSRRRRRPRLFAKRMLSPLLTGAPASSRT